MVAAFRTPGHGPQSAPLAPEADATAQRHTIPDSRTGVGGEDDEIQAMRLVQRQVAFGNQAIRERRNNPWGDGRPADMQRKGGGAAVADKAAGAKVGPAPEGVSLTPEEAAEKKAKTEFKDFVKGGPYTIPDFVPDTIDDFGKFDAIYLLNFDHIEMALDAAGDWSAY